MSFTEELTPLTKERLRGIIDLAVSQRAKIIVSPVFYEDARTVAEDSPTPFHAARHVRVAVGPEVVIDYTLPGSMWRLEGEVVARG